METVFRFRNCLGVTVTKNYASVCNWCYETLEAGVSHGITHRLAAGETVSHELPEMHATPGAVA